MFGIEALRAFYLGDAAAAESRFHIWDRGEAVGDSVTPSTYSRQYQLWMNELLRKFLDHDGDDPALLSVGCGNAIIEAELVTAGYKVLGVDALAEAVEFAKAKGVDAVCADVLTWTPPDSTRWSMIYADGILGHIFDQTQGGIQHLLTRFRSWLPDGKGVLVMSNDEPRTDAHVQAHSEVPGFSWLSGPFLHGQAEAAGFQDIWTTWFTYHRPLSGPRERVVVTART